MFAKWDLFREQIHNLIVFAILFYFILFLVKGLDQRYFNVIVTLTRQGEDIFEFVLWKISLNLCYSEISSLLTFFEVLIVPPRRLLASKVEECICLKKERAQYIWVWEWF